MWLTRKVDPTVGVDVTFGGGCAFYPVLWAVTSAQLLPLCRELEEPGGNVCFFRSVFCFYAALLVVFVLAMTTKFV